MTTERPSHESLRRPAPGTWGREATDILQEAIGLANLPSVRDQVESNPVAAAMVEDLREQASAQFRDVFNSRRWNEPLDAEHQQEALVASTATYISPEEFRREVQTRRRREAVRKRLVAVRAKAKAKARS